MRHVILSLAVCFAPAFLEATHGQNDDKAALSKTYAGRTFDEWKTLVKHDLDPETRAKALTAIGVLGHHGERAEAISVINDVVETEEEIKVRESGYAAILTFGADGIPAIKAGIGAEDARTRRLAAAALEDFYYPGSQTDKKQLPWDVVVPLLLEALEDEDERVRVSAAEAIKDALRYHSPKDHAEKVLPALMKVAEDDDEGVETAYAAILAIGRHGVHAKPAVPLLIKLAKLEEAPARNRQRFMQSRPLAAIATLGQLGSTAEGAIPALEELAKADRRRRGPSAFIAKRALDRIRAATKDDSRL